MTPEAMFPLAFIAYCLSGFLLSAHIRMKREMKDLSKRLEAMEAAASGASSE
jgi:hypothetical protein